MVGLSLSRLMRMTTFLMRHAIEHGKKRERWCVSHPIDPKSLSAAYLEETEVMLPEEERQDEISPAPQKMACLPEL